MYNAHLSAMFTPGTLLRLAREERKLSLADVKLVCKIRETALHAMETDQYERFPDSYMRTFLPEYVAFLGIPSKIFADSLAKHFPEREDLHQYFSAHALRQTANEQIYDTESSFTEQSRTFVRKNARKGFVGAIVGVLAWLVVSVGGDVLQFDTTQFGRTFDTTTAATTAPAAEPAEAKTEQGFFQSLLAKVIVPTPENMRGTPFTEVIAPPPAENSHQAGSHQAVSQINRTKSNTLNDMAQLEAEKNETIRREEEMQHTNAKMRVISLAAILPMQRELQNALEQGFETIMHDEKADARMRRQTSLASVSLSAAKTRLEKDANKDANKDVNNTLNTLRKNRTENTEKATFFTADMEENEEEHETAENNRSSNDAGTISNTRLEDLRSNAEAMRARIALIMQTRRFAASGASAEQGRMAAAASTSEQGRISSKQGIMPRIEPVTLQALSTVQSIDAQMQQAHMQQRFAPIHVQLPQDWAHTANSMDASADN
ncbi:MAG: hypothetical protein EAZ92_03405 [Candidatus Kapaibacterium sp.]|nr:MAG: hypothetical protein EAZ92_03405 [Candidatus Kapabacteria bacterium]